MPEAPPPGAEMGTLAMRDGTELYTVRYAPAAPPKAVVVIVHGLKDHSANYAAFATRLAGLGYVVHALDLRGHGRSAGPRVAPGNWMRFVDDVDRLVREAEKREPGLPVFVFGHSMGGAIATLTAMQHEPRVAGVILSAPALAVDAPPLLIAATRMAGALMPGAAALDLPDGEFSSDPAVVAALRADPLVEHSKAPARTAAGLVDGMRVIWASLDRLEMPVLALHGTRDALTAPAGSRMLIRGAAATDKTLRIYDGFKHDLLHEPRHADVEADVIAWLEAHTGGPALAPAAMFTGRLRGEPAGWTQAVQVDAGVVSDGDEDIAFAGALALHLARPRPLGWHGSLTAQWAGDYRAASLRPLGLAVRGGPAVLGASGGVSLIDGANFSISAGAWLELPFGPAHLSLLAERQRRVSNTNMHGPLASDQLWTSASLRFGGERWYWPGAYAGVGPVLTGGMAWLADERAWFLTLGLQLYGAD